MERIIEIQNNILTINQDLKYGYAGEVWDAALVLSYFLKNDKTHEYFPLNNKVILELGAGTGICGLVTTYFNPNLVILTDKEDNVPILIKNYEANKNSIKTEVRIIPLDWNNKEHYNGIKEKIDYILCSDLIWNMDYFNSLLNTLDYFYNDDTIIIMSYTYRKDSDSEFFKMFKERYWNIEKIPEDLYDEDYRSDDIILLKVKKFIK